MNMYTLYRRLHNTNIGVYALHPGVMDTPILGDLEQSNLFYNVGIKMYKVMGEYSDISNEYFSTGRIFYVRIYFFC